MVTSRTTRRHGWRRFVVFAAGILVVGSSLATPVVASPRPVVSPPAGHTDALVNPTSTIKLTVESARTEPRAFGGDGVHTGDPVTAFKWMINLDNTGTTDQRNANPGSGCSPQDASYPDSCKWASIAGLRSSAPVVAQGDETSFPSAGLTLPTGRYLVSVLADGYQLDGTPFAIPMESPGNVIVPLQPWPLPTATIKAQVFMDVTEANGQYDPGEDGISGFAGKITDYLGQVNTDVFGNPLCTTYEYTDANGNGIQDPGEINLLAPDYEPTLVHLGGKCLSGDINMDGVVNGTDESLYASLGLDPTLARGELTIPNLGTNRYALSVVAPTGTSWVQTTTLEGNHDWDAWVMEGSTGYDTEFVVGAEPFPATVFGFLPAASNSYWNQTEHKFQAGGHGTIKGVVDAVDVYIPQTGGLFLPTVGFQGAKIDHAISKPWIALSDLNRGDTAVYLGRGNANGTFQIDNVPDGSYTLTYWDEPQDYILDLLSVTISGGEVVDTGVLPMTGWFSKFDGYVFNDLNRNGKRDDGEPGVPNFGLTLRGRANNLMDRGSTTKSTDSSGHYSFDQAYPLTEWLVLEAYDDRYYTTGITYQADNQPEPTTVLGAGVDVSVLPIIGLNGTLDWGVHFYDATGDNGTDPQNGGIVGSISYDTTRNELDPQYAAAEDWQPGVSGITVELRSPVDCGTHPGTPCDANGDYELASDGSYAEGKLLNTYISETWERPTDCVARDVDGDPLTNPGDQQVLPIGAGKPCLEGPLMGIQFGPYPTDQGTVDANFGAAVDGNYGFGDGCFDGTLDASDPSAPECVDGSFTGLEAGDYLVHIDLVDKVDERGDPIYKVTREEDINIGNGDQFVPAVPPPACAGALHTVDVAGDGTDGYAAAVLPDPSGNGGSDLNVPASSPTDNPTFVDIAASPYEGNARPLCDTKLVTLQNGKSVVPMFNIFTDVPLPGRFFGLTVDDLMATTDPKSLLVGEKAPLAFNPVGIYDAWNRLITTVETDYNGIYDVLLPSTNRINCPTPSGVCSNVYRFVGNDPGTPGRLNLNYNPAYRTIAAEFEAFAGLTMPADTAPTPVGASIELPGTTQVALLSCPVNAPDVTAANRIPELYAVSRPYTTGTLPQFAVYGRGFGATKGSGQLTLDGTPIATATWNDTQITVTATIPVSIGQGPHQLMVTANNGKTTVNGLTFHRIGGSYDPPIYEVGPTNNPNYSAAKVSAGPWFTPAETLPAAADHAVQRALDAAPAGALVVVYPNKPTADPRQNPRGAYYENLIITKRVKLQGVGPGAPDGSVPGAIVDGGAFGGDSPVEADWYTRMNTVTWAGNQDVFDGAVISLYLPSSGGNAFPTSFSSTTAPTIDGFDLRGGDQLGFPGNLGDLLGVPGEVGVGVTQGGAIFANAYARNLQITNNVVQNNGGTYGTIRIGTPDLPDPDNQNDAVRIMTNRIVSNGGTNLAGGIGIFAGTDGYVVRANDICGNFSSEYGGGLTVYGRSPNGSIDHNRVYRNQSYDEGGGIMIAGQLPTDPSLLSPGSGAASIHDNLVQENLADDDGGGIRFLMASTDCDSTSAYRPCAIDVYNNFIVNNISSHEGGGVALDDAPNVRIYNNTIMKNVTTATAVTSNGLPAPAGLSTGHNSSQLQAPLNATYPTAPVFSNPLLFNNVFWDNRAGTRSGSAVVGIGAAGDATAINQWDLGTADGSGLLAPTNSIVQQIAGTHPYTTSPTNVASDPQVLDPSDVSLVFAPWRTNPNFVGAIIVGLDLPPKLLGDYHLGGTGSPAFNLGAVSKAVPPYQQPPSSLSAPTTDIDGQARPARGGFDAGADEIPPPLANLAITKTDGTDTVQPGGSLTYTIVVSNGGPASVTGASVTDTFPAGLTVNSWSCVPASNCTAGGSGNSRTGTVTLPAGDSATFTAQVTLSASATPGSLANTSTIALASGDITVDPDIGNNSATDTDAIVLPLPTVALLDNFNRANANNLGVNWSPSTGTQNVRLNSNQAVGNSSGQAMWNNPTTDYGTSQGAAFTFVQNGTSPSAPVTNTWLILKATGGTTTTPASYLRALYDTGGGGRIVVGWTTNSGGGFTAIGTFNTGSWSIGDTLTAVANANGSVDIWRNASYVGRSSTSAFTGTGRIGIRLASGSRVDDFKGQTLP